LAPPVDEERDCHLPAVQVTENTETAPLARSAADSGGNAVIEIDMPSGARVRVGVGANLNVLRGVFAALDGR
jgi:hypothetical protein